MNGIRHRLLLHHWCRYGGLFTKNGTRIDEWWRLCNLSEYKRPRYKAGTSYPVIWVDVPLMDISSSMVRVCAKGRTPNFMLPKPVLDYIKKEGIVSMTYENYHGFSREVLLEKNRQILPEKRLTHCLGVEGCAWLGQTLWGWRRSRLA